MSKNANNSAAVVLATALILVAGSISYVNSLLNPFIWDDIALIVRNFHIGDLGYIPRLFLEGSYHQDITGNFYRPVLMASFALDYRYWGLEPFGYHLANLFLHLSNALLVYCLVWLLSKKRTVSFLAALLFAVHPVHTEAVTYISGRGDPLAAFFSLLSLLCFIKFTGQEGVRKTAFYAVSVVFFAIAVFTKESALVLPAFFALYSACFAEDKSRFSKGIPYIPFLAVIAIFLCIRHMALAGISDAGSYISTIPLPYRILTAPAVIAEYIKILVVPAGLHMERMDFLYNVVVSAKDPRFLAPSVFLISSVLALALWHKRPKLFLFGAVWFAIGLLPFINIIPINAFVAEHWLYFPSIGFFIAVSVLLDRITQFKSIKLCVKAFIVVLVLMLSVLTIRQNLIWRDPVAFYKYTLAYSPESTRLHTNLGIEYFNRGLFEKAENEYMESLRIEPDGKNTVYHLLNLAAMYYYQGREDEAFDAYKKAIAADPLVPVTYANLGDIYYRKGKYKDSVSMFKRALEIAPGNAAYWNSLGNAYLAEKMDREAGEAYRKAIAIYPYLLDSRVNLGGIYARKGDLVAALEEYKVALQIAPDVPEIYTRVSELCSRMGAHEQAKYFSDRAKELLTK
ncbi:MAG: tetratricopeptide repeat protein [Candidatus Omnitrophota bacterium]